MRDGRGLLVFLLALIYGDTAAAQCDTRYQDCRYVFGSAIVPLLLRSAALAIPISCRVSIGKQRRISIGSLGPPSAYGRPYDSERTRDYASLYAGIAGEPFPVPAVDLSQINPEFLRASVKLSGERGARHNYHRS